MKIPTKETIENVIGHEIKPTYKVKKIGNITNVYVEVIKPVEEIKLTITLKK